MPKAAGAVGGFVHSRIDAALVDVRTKDPEELTDSAKSAHESVPDISVHPIGETRRHGAERDHGAFINLVEPHFVFEKAEQRRLRLLERIGLAGLAIHQNAEPDANDDERERNEKHRLNKER